MPLSSNELDACHRAFPMLWTRRPPKHRSNVLDSWTLYTILILRPGPDVLQAHLSGSRACRQPQLPPQVQQRCFRTVQALVSSLIVCGTMQLRSRCSSLRTRNQRRPAREALLFLLLARTGPECRTVISLLRVELHGICGSCSQSDEMCRIR